MAGYNEIKGLRVKYLSADPSNAENGQVWYNSTTGNLRVLGIGSGAWISSTPLSEARRLGGGFGITSAAITFGGFGPPDNKTTSEEYNGSGWTSGGALNNGTARFAGSVGTLTAGLTAGGLSTPTVYQNSAEEYNGTAWTSVTNLPVARGAGSTGGIGIQTAAIIAVGGTGIPTTADAATLKYDGTNWTAGGSMNTARVYTAGFGTQTAGLYMGGAPGTKANVELYDGTSWSETTDMNTGRYSLVTSNNSPQTSGIGASGYAAPGLSVATESWDGSSWTNQSNMATARNAATGAGANSSSVMVSGGQTPTQSKAVEEYNFGTSTFTAGAFASGGAYPAQFYGLGASCNGTQTSAIAFAGNKPGATSGNTETNLYNGSTWSSQPSMSVARAYLAGFGTATAGVAVGGLVPPGATGSPATEEYDGEGWTAGGALNTGRWNLAGAGTLTAGLAVGGSPGPLANAEEYNGTAWSNVTSMPATNNDQSGNGPQTAALIAGGGPPSSDARETLEYDGTNWTVGGTLAQDHKRGALMAGGITDGILAGGHTGPGTETERYDGTSWASTPQLATARGRAGNVGTATAGLVVGGNPSATNATEEWTDKTETPGSADNITTS